MYWLRALLLLGSTIAIAQSPEAVQRFQIDAQNGDANAAFWLGVAYRDANGVTRDLTRAVEWLSRSAGAGNPDAADALGQLYEDGIGVHRDSSRAATLYRFACEQRPDHGGAGHGCNDLGLLYLEGRGVVQDKVEAYKYFRLSRSEVALSDLRPDLTPDQIAEGERRVRDWHRVHPER